MVPRIAGSEPERCTMQETLQKRKVCIALEARLLENEGTNEESMNLFKKFQQLEQLDYLGMSMAQIRGSLFAWALLSISCASMTAPSLPTNETRDYPIYKVMSDRAPFYQSSSPTGKWGNKGYPYLYLSKGMTVTMLKNDVPYSNVLLLNGMKGWMPISSLAPQMTTGEGSAAVSPAPGTTGSSGPPAGPGRSKAAAGHPSPDVPVQLPSYY